MMRVRPIAAGLATVLALASPTSSEAGGPYALTDVSVTNGKPKPDAPSIKHWFLPGQLVWVSVKVRNDGAPPDPQETIALQAHVEFAPGPGQTPPPIAEIGEGLTAAPPPSGQTASHILLFHTPAKEGLYTVRVSLQGQPPNGYYMGHSAILVQSERPLLLVRRARVMKYSGWICPNSGGGFLFPPTPLIPVPPTVLDSQGENCTPRDQTRIKVENAGTKASKPFKVSFFDQSGCYSAVSFAMPAIPAKKSAWTPPATLEKIPLGGCEGPYSVRIAPPPDEGGSVGASELVFTGADVFRSTSKGDTSDMKKFLLNN
jgi:hypothetical protein